MKIKLKLINNYYLIHINDLVIVSRSINSVLSLILNDNNNLLSIGFLLLASVAEKKGFCVLSDHYLMVSKFLRGSTNELYETRITDREVFKAYSMARSLLQ